MLSSMEASQELIHIPAFMKDENLREETKRLISSLPLERDINGLDLCNYQGCWYYYSILQAVLDFQKHYRPQNTDIIIASFPKSGTTWLKALTFAVVNRTKYTQNPENHPLLFDNPHNLVPFFEVKLYSNNQIPDLTQLSSPRLFGTHIPYHTLRETLKDSPCKIIYVCRDMKDTLVSRWHFKSKYQRKELHSDTFETYLGQYFKGVYPGGPFWDNVLSYWKGSQETPKCVLFMKYEDIIQAPKAQIKKLAEFLEYPFTEEEERRGVVDGILKLCSLSNLSNLEVNKNGISMDIDNKSFFRKGEVGDWKNYLSPEIAKKLDDIVKLKLQGSGLEFK